MSPLVPERILKLVSDWSLKQTPQKMKHTLSTPSSSTSIAASCQSPNTSLLWRKLPIFFPVLKESPAPHPFFSPSLPSVLC